MTVLSYLDPLAPFLFFFVEAISYYLIAQDIGLQDLNLDIWKEELLNVEFDDNNATSLRKSIANLALLQQALEYFCLALDAYINRHKSFVFWTRPATPTKGLEK